MTYDVQIVVINPITYKATRQLCVFTFNSPPDYEDVVGEFFRCWDKKDKYDVCYSIGVESMNLHDNKN